MLLKNNEEMNESNEKNINLEKILKKNITKPFKKCHIDKFIYADDGRFIFLGRSITQKVNLATKKNEIKLHICNKDKTIIELIDDISEVKNFKINHIYNSDEAVNMYNVSFEYFHVRYKVTCFE